MPKLKTHSGAKKRFEFTKTGKIKRGSAFHTHMLINRSQKRKRNLRKGGYVDVTNVKNVRAMLPYA